MAYRSLKILSAAGIMALCGPVFAMAHPLVGQLVHAKPMGGPTTIAGTPLDGPPNGFPSSMMPVAEPGQHLTYVQAVLKPIDIVKHHEVFLKEPPIKMVVAMGRIGRTGVSVQGDHGAWFGLSAYLGTTNAYRGGTTVADRLINFTVYRTGQPGPAKISGDFQLPGMLMAGNGKWNGVFIMDGHSYDTTISFHADRVVTRGISAGVTGRTVVAFPDEVWNSNN
jgi:hypothetical protein